MARYVPKHMRKRKLRERRRPMGIAAVVIAGIASLSGTFGYTPGALAVDPSKPLAEQVAAMQSNPTGTIQQTLTPVEVPPVAPAVDISTASLPLYVNIPAIGVGSELMSLGLEEDGSLEVPADFNQAGWFRGGAIPGEVGPAVIAGHLDSILGPAIFSRLSELKPGDIIKVLRRDSVVLTFSVTRIDNYLKDYFPSDMVYGSTAEPELRLITCGGTFNKSAHSYAGNTVVYAKLVADTGSGSQ